MQQHIKPTPELELLPEETLASIVSLREAALALVLVLCVAAPFSFALCSSTLIEFVLSIYSCCFHNNFHDSCTCHQYFSFAFQKPISLCMTTSSAEKVYFSWELEILTL
jgi:hypothetical protein